MTLRAAALLVLCALATGCCGPVRGLYPPVSEAPGESAEFFVVNNHWHTGLVLPMADLPPTLRRYLARFESYRYVEIGWGDSDFYRSTDETSGLAMRAMFASRGTALHVAGIDDPPEHYKDYVVDLYRIRVGRDGFARLSRFVESTFDSDADGNAVELQNGLYGYSRFYQACGRYGAFRTCNHWLADGVRQTGFPISSFYAATADNVGWQIRVFGRRYQSDVMVFSQ